MLVSRSPIQPLELPFPDIPGGTVIDHQPISCIVCCILPGREP